MSKGQKRSNREPKKRKKVKSKAVASVVTSLMSPVKPDIFARGKKK